MHAAGEAVEDLVDFADGKVLDGTMEKNRLIFPARRRLRKWLTSIFDVGDSAAAESQDGLERGPHLVRIGDSFAQRRDPEHLPPVNLWQRSGEALRSASNLLGSEESMFGLRCACATMTIAIVCFLEQTEFFFQEQRLVWAMIMIAIGMTRSKYLDAQLHQQVLYPDCFSFRTVHLRLVLPRRRQSRCDDSLLPHLVHPG